MTQDTNVDMREGYMKTPTFRLAQDIFIHTHVVVFFCRSWNLETLKHRADMMVKEVECG